MNWKKVVQLTLIHIGVAMTVVPVNSTLNRIMIADLGFSALLVALLISLPYLLSPFQAVIGDWADRHPIWGRHRSPWIVMGGLMAAFGSYFTAHAVYLMVDHFALGLLAALLAFMLWGLGVNIASVSYLSLASELSEGNEAWRSRTVSIMWTCMIVSVILTGITIAHLIDPYTVSALYTAFGMVWSIAVLLVLVGSAHLEPSQAAKQHLYKSEKSEAKAPPAQRSNPLIGLHLLREQPSARRFFVYLLLVLISIYAQDVLLEPYGGEVLQMAQAQTSRLTSIWGVGVLLTMLGGVSLLQRMGKKPSANLGAVVAAVGFGLVIFSGVMQSTSIFRLAVLVVGLGGGLMTVSNLSFMLDMTHPQAAGLYMGVWGVADFLGRAVGNLVGGLLRDSFHFFTGNVAIGYYVVFGLEVVGLLCAIVLFRAVSVQEFRSEAEARLERVGIWAAD